MEINSRPININITTLTILKVIVILFLLYFFYLIKDILAVLFVSVILSSALDPWVDWMQSKKIPRSLGVIFIYLSLFLLIGLILFLIIPPIVNEIGELSTNFPHYFEKVISSFSSIREYAIQHGILDNITGALGSLSSNLQKAGGGIFSTVSGIFGGIFSFFLVLVLSFYMIVEENAMKKLVWSLAPEKHQPYLTQLINRIQKKIGLWLRGQLILSLFIFILDFVGLSVLGVKYALVLALIAGVTELVPYLGPILGAIPAVFLAFAQSPMLALFTAILFYIVQMIENHILVPKIMQKIVGLNPIVSITVLLIGFNIGGVVGAILSIPVATAVSVFLKDIFEHKEEEERLAHHADKA